MAKRKETVTRIFDGDTFLTKPRAHPVRLANVDAPEKGTRAGKAATNALRKLIGGEKVKVYPVARDTYGRTVAKVTVNGKSVNKTMRGKLKK